MSAAPFDRGWRQAANDVLARYEMDIVPSFAMRARLVAVDTGDSACLVVKDRHVSLADDSGDVDGTVFLRSDVWKAIDSPQADLVERALTDGTLRIEGTRSKIAAYFLYGVFRDAPDEVLASLGKI